MIDKIKQIITLFEQSKLSEMDVEFEDMKLSLKKPSIEQVNTQLIVPEHTPSVLETSNTQEDKVEEGHWIQSPLVGIFYESPSPSADPFVSVGTSVKKGDVLCVIEAMKVMNEIKSTHDGVIAEIKAENEQMVEFNQPLFRIVAHD